PLVATWLPGFNPRLLMWLAGSMAVLVAVGGPAGAVWLHMHGARNEAIKGAKAACELRISEGARASAQALAELLATISRDDDGDAGKTADAMCKGSPFCRD